MARKMLLIILISIFFLAACSGASAPEPGYYSEIPAADAGVTYEAEGAPAISGESYDSTGSYTIQDSTVPADAQRMVIKNADLSVVVPDPVQKMDEITKMAEAMGGFVVTSNMWQSTLSSGLVVPQGNITVRVPSERLNEALEAIKKGASEVLTENVSGQDVTGDYTDLESRLRNLESAESQLQAIMDEAIKTEDVLSVYNELVRVREQIELIKGQMKYMEESARLSAISVNITADEANQPLQIGGWQPVGVAKEAIEVMIKTMQALVNVLIWVVLCVLPVGVVIGLPLFFVVRAVNRTRKRRKLEKAAAQAVETPAQE